MKILIVLTFISLNTFANNAITTMSDYAKHAMTEVAANPTLELLENKKGESQHGYTIGYLSTKIDDDATLSTGSVVQESGDASGVGIGYGYSYSFKERWAFFLTAQAIAQEGDHVQTLGAVTTERINDFAATYFNLSFGLSYEFLREKPKHVLNLFFGPSLMMIDVSGAIQEYNNSGSIVAAYDGSYDDLLPAAMIGLMYEYKYFEKFQIATYAILVHRLVGECQGYRIDNVALSNPGASANSPECDPTVTGTAEGETDIAPSFLTVGFKFNYKPWDLDFNVSGVLRDLILREDEEDRAVVKGSYLSISKSY